MLEGPGDFVTLLNEGDEPFTYRCLGQLHTLEPGRRRIVPWAHLDHLLGNPFLTNATNERARAKEYERIRTLYGHTTPREEWPKLAAFDSDGDRITTIVDDPEGENAPTLVTHEGLDVVALQAQVAQQQRRLDQMTSLLAVQGAAEAARAKGGPIPTDAPENPAPVVGEIDPTTDPDDTEPTYGPTPQPEVPEDKPNRAPAPRGGPRRGGKR